MRHTTPGGSGQKQFDCRPWCQLEAKVGTRSGERLLSVREASGRLGLSVSGVRQWVLLRKIAYHEIGRAVRIEPAEVERILAEGYVPARNANQGRGRSEERSGRRPRRNRVEQAEANR